MYGSETPTASKRALMVEAGTGRETASSRHRHQCLSVCIDVPQCVGRSSPRLYSSARPRRPRPFMPLVFARVAAAVIDARISGISPNAPRAAIVAPVSFRRWWQKRRGGGSLRLRLPRNDEYKELAATMSALLRSPHSRAATVTLEHHHPSDEYCCLYCV